MRPALILALVLAGFAPSAASAGEPFDVPFFQANPRTRAQVLHDCANDAERNRHPVCENARAAETRGRLGRPLSRTPSQFERELPAYLRRT